MKCKIMGILNVTPDSFYDGNRNFSFDAAVKKGLGIAKEGADIIDVGGESTRPGSSPVEEHEELQRVIPVIKELKRLEPNLIISIDTMKPKVAKAAIEAGASLINDVTGFRDPLMREIAAQSGVKVCVMHMLGMPKTMQINPLYPKGVLDHILAFFETQIRLLIKAGVSESQIILDPGIGFGKTVADNLEILQNLQKIRYKGLPLLIGISRKSFISKLLKTPADGILQGTLVLNALAISAGVDIIRVHDIREHHDVIQILTCGQ